MSGFGTAFVFMEAVEIDSYWGETKTVCVLVDDYETIILICPYVSTFVFISYVLNMHQCSQLSLV